MITAEKLRELLMYTPETGQFLRRFSSGGSKAGGIAGSLIKRTGYIEISLGNKSHLGHRLAWLYVHGEWPKGQIDHINGDRADNRMDNLRDVSAKQNSQNRRSPVSHNKLGLLGVTEFRRGKFVASLCVDGRQTYLGTFPTPESAHAAYVSAKREHHAGCTL